MKSLNYFPSDLLCIVLLASFVLSGCKRDIPPLPPGELRDITFKLRGFEAETMPLEGQQATAGLAFNEKTGGETYALRNIEPGLEPQYLYYWSFNEETLDPDIAVDEAGAGITFEANNEIADFVVGRASTPFEPGRALAIKGAQSLTISLPIVTVESLTGLAFDIKSSDTGPKDFALSYSVDGGTTYEEWSASNQFEKTGNSQWNGYTFNTDDFSAFVEVEMLLFKLDFLPGNRGGAAYSESSGVVHLDNIRLSGIYNGKSSDPTAPRTLHYYIFSSDDGSVVQQQQLSMDALGEGGLLDVKLADGTYDVLFVAYRSDKGMLLPENLTHANEFYFGQHFDDHRAVTYAILLDDVVISGDDAEMAATLKRCYSLVEFDFTDLAADLQRVEKIEIAKGHDDFLYTPFGMPATVEQSEVERIIFRDFSSPEDYQVALHQFFGLLDGTGEISYEVTAYGEGDVALNTVTITQAIRNNIRLRLRGRLLGDTGAINGFSVSLDTEWGELLDYGF